MTKVSITKQKLSYQRAWFVNSRYGYTMKVCPECGGRGIIQHDDNHPCTCEDGFVPTDEWDKLEYDESRGRKLDWYDMHKLIHRRRARIYPPKSNHLSSNCLECGVPLFGMTQRLMGLCKPCYDDITGTIDKYLNQ